MRERAGACLVAVVIVFFSLAARVQAQTSVLFWTESTDTNRINLTVQKSGNRYLVSNLVPPAPGSRKVYYFADWDMIGTSSSPGAITNLDLEPAQMHMIHTYEVDSSYTVNDYWNANANRSTAVAFLWIGGAPQAQTNMSATLSEVRESGSWFYFEKTNHLSSFSQRFPNFSLPAGKVLLLDKASLRDTTAGYAAHGVTKTSITPGPNTFNNKNETNFLATTTWSDMTSMASWANQYDYMFLDFEFWNSDYMTGTMARLAFFMNECRRVNPNSHVGDWWAGTVYARGFIGNPGTNYNPGYVVPDYSASVAYSHGDQTLLTVVDANGVMTNMAGAASLIPINAYVDYIFPHQDVASRPDIGRADNVIPQLIHRTRVNKRIGVNVGKSHVWFCANALFPLLGEPAVAYSTRTTSPPGVFTWQGEVPFPPNMAEALSFFGLFEGDGVYVWGSGGNCDGNPNSIFSLAKYCRDYNDTRGVWTPDVPGTPIGNSTNGYNISPNFSPDYTALGAWKYSAIADIITNGVKTDFRFSTNNGVTWYNPPTNGSVVCEIATNFSVIVVGAVSTSQIAIAAYAPYLSVTGKIHVVVQYAANNYAFDVQGKRVRVFRGGLLAPILVPPVITHSPVAIVESAPPFTITAGATDDVQIASAVLWWNRNGGAWTSTPMSIEAGIITGTFTPPIVTNLDQFQYRIDVLDDQGLAATNGPNSFIYSQTPVPALVHAGTAWKYLATNAGPSATWKDVGFDDSLWPTGTTPMGYGSDADIVTTLSYGGVTNNRYPTTYFRTTFVTTNVAALLALNLYARVDDGMVVYLNGTEVQRITMPGGTVSYTNLASGSASNAPRPWQVFAINPANVLNGQNTLAVEVHQAAVNSSDLYFDLQLQPASVFNWPVPVSPVLLRSVQTTAPPWTVTAQTTNSAQVASMKLLWNRNGGAWSNVPMSGTGGIYTASLSPGAIEDGDQFGYQIQTLSLLGASTVNGAYGFMYMIPRGSDLLPPESTWKYLATNTAPSASWNTVGFNDASWPSGVAPLGYGSENDAATVISYGPQSTNKYPTYYFRKTFSVTNPAGITGLKAYLRVDDGLVVYINGAEAGRQNMAAGVVTYSTYASGSGANAPRTWSDIDINPGLLVTGANTIAVEVHQVNAGSSDAFFDIFLQPDTAMSVSHTPLSSIQTSPAPWTVSARVNSYVPLASVNLFVGRNFGAMTSVPMTLSSGNYVAVISPTGLVDHEQFQYRIEAVDTLGTAATNGPIGFMYSIEAVPALITAGSGWQYLAQATAPDSTWNLPLFDDSSWPVGLSPLGIGTVEKIATVVDYGPDSNNKYTSYYFRDTFTLDKAAAIKTLQAYCRVDDGLVLYLNGQEMSRVNMPTGVITHASFAASNASNPPRPWVQLAVNKSMLVDGTNTLAVEVHQVNLTSTDLSFDFHLYPTWQPAITHTVLPSFTTSPPPWQVTADVESYYPLTSVKLWWMKVGGSWTSSVMTDSGTFIGTIAPTSAVDHDLYQYRIEAQDSTGQTITNGPFGFMYGSPPPITLVAAGSGWKYWGTNTGASSGWNTVGFSDTNWSVGNASFGFGGNETYGTVLSYGPSSSNKYPAYYFRRTFTLTGTATLISFKGNFQVDDGMVMYINGAEAYRTNLPSGTMSYTNLALGGAANEPRPWPALSLNPSLVVTGQNTIAIEVHQSSASSSDLFMDMYLYGTATNSTDSDADGMPDSWESSNFGGSTNGVPSADPDGDRVSNLEEYITGCDPNSSFSKPQIHVSSMTNAFFMLGIQTASNRLYVVDYSTNIVSPTWTVLTNVSGDGSYVTFSGGTNVSSRGWYYRYRARLP